jgi:hypothetical protein
MSKLSDAAFEYHKEAPANMVDAFIDGAEWMLEEAAAIAIEQDMQSIDVHELLSMMKSSTMDLPDLESAPYVIRDDEVSMMKMSEDEADWKLKD